jgi:hypothetical protein
MITFHSRRLDCGRRARKNKNADTFNFTSQFASSICIATFTNRVEPDATIFKSRCSRTVVCYRFGRVEAEPLVRTRFLRLANSLPKSARSPARRSRDVRETSGKKSGEISRVVSRNAAAIAMLPSVRQDDSQANLSCAGLGRAMSARKLARRLATWSRYGRATVKATSRKTTRSNLNHDIQRK